MILESGLLFWGPPCILLYSVTVLIQLFLFCYRPLR